MRAFVSETGADAFTHVVDADGALWTRFGVVSQPAFVFVASSGAAEVFAGSLGVDDLRAALDDLA
ncbi:MAG: hypothetical protein M3381_03320 [Actinomycetota bacterium]|nr:hypothetical protein [Actinomycetota bacterium]